MDWRFDDAGNLLGIRFPRYVFKYSPIKQYTISAIKNAQLWFSHVDELNDPFECQNSYYLPDISKRELSAWYKKTIKRHASHLTRKQRRYALSKALGESNEERISSWREVLLDIRSNAFVCCFSEDGHHPLMWAHYADSHKGICLVFSCYELYNFGFDGMKVEYYDTRPPPMNAYGGKSSTHERYLSKKYLIGAKSHLWAYEREVRFNSSEHGLNEFRRVALKAIIAGARVSDAEISALKAATSGYGHEVPVVRAALDLDKWTISTGYEDNWYFDGRIVLHEEETAKVWVLPPQLDGSVPPSG